jgi:hypothetical protein
MNEHWFSDWQPMYAGIDRAIGSADMAFDLDPPTPRKQNVNAVRIRLGNPAAVFKCTAGANQLTPGDTVTSFMEANPDVVLAFNASFSCIPGTCSGSGNDFPIFGLAVSNGALVSDPSGASPCGNGLDVPDDASVGCVALVIDNNRNATFQVLVAGDPLPASIHAAIAGSPQPQVAGECPPYPFILIPSNPNPAAARYLYDSADIGIMWPAEVNPVEEIAGRTTMGLDDQYLYVVTIDGREPNSSDEFLYGAGYHDAGWWLRKVGAKQGINLDGGGSTCIGRRIAKQMLGSGNTIALMNVPYGDETFPGQERKVGIIFGVAVPMS